MKGSLVRFGLYMFIFSVCAVGIVSSQTAPSSMNGKKQADVFANLKFRNLGPAVAGGRVSAVVGVVGNPNVYYVGGAGAGVFKSEDGGLTWKQVFEKESTSSIGAIAIDPSNSQVVWVGTGEANIRNDIIDGRGVFMSPDGGHSWKFMGLDDAGQISSVIVDPNDSNTVLVGAVGHAWGPNEERGVFKTTDGGKTWKKVLYVDNTTGVADMVMAPHNPKVLFAAMWTVRRYPWNMVDGGPTSAIYRSTDGGDTWQKLTEDMPKGPLGRIALAIAPTNPQHIYALIEAKTGMLWQSLDMGDHWTMVNNSHALDVRGFYFSKLVVSPENENHLFFLSFNLEESLDGGKTFHAADHGVHPDHHAIWIDPKNPNRIIQGNDGGVFLTLDGAKHWTFVGTMTLEEFYQVAASSETPYTLCGGLQDNSAWCGPSSDLGRFGVTGPAWYTVVGGDGEYSVPAPSDSNIIYSDSQDGDIVRLDKKTHESRFIRPYLESAEQMKPADLKYRFNWTAPIAVSRTNANEVYLGANVLFRSMDGGQHWTVISPDLTRNDKAKQEEAGGPVFHDMSSAENYDTLLSITIAPTDANVIWVGTDDGLVQVTHDGGKTWTNVAAHIAGAPEWAMVSQIGVSPFDAGTAYVAFDAHKLDNRHVYVYKTTDFGKTWTSISSGLPENDPAHVVREDPNHRGLLVLGNDTGLFYSADAGAHWMPLKADFPTVPVWDLKFVKATGDLAVATHGRGLFVLDDLRPLEELTPQIEASEFHLFTPAPGTLFHRWSGVGGEGRGAGYFAPNAPPGVIVDYYLKSEIKQPKMGGGAEGATPGRPGGMGPGEHGPVKIVVTDNKGAEVATLHAPAKAGINRFVWNMRYDGPERLKFAPMVPQGGGGFFNMNAGPMVVPGTYHIAVTVKDQTEKAAVEVKPDPMLHATLAGFEAQTASGLEGLHMENALIEMLNRLDGMQKSLTGFESSVSSSKDPAEKTKYADMLKQAKELGQKISKLKDSVYDPKVQRNAPEDSIHYLADFYGKLRGVAFGLGAAYGEPPNELARSHMTELRTQLAGYLSQYNALAKSDVAGYNKAAFKEGAPTLFTGSPLELKTAETK